MLVENAEQPSAATTAAQHASFFRQSGWLMIANIAGGMLMWGVHFLSKALPEKEYGLFGTLLSVAMCIPAMPLQMVLAQQTARALATHRERELAGMIRLVWLGLSFLWLLASVVVLVFQHQILANWSITNPMALWVTLIVVLMSLWSPMFSGVLQGQQNFLWLGWTMILNGVGRVAISVFAVFVLGSYVTGMMTGVLIGLVVAAALGIWQTRALWLTPALPFDWRSLLRQVVPLMLGFGAFQFLFTADTMFVRSYFTGDEAPLTAFYVVAGTLSRALMWLVGPLASVMFPRIVHSTAKAEKNNMMGIVLIGTAVLAITGGLGLSLVGPWVVRFVAKASYVQEASALLPWYAGAIVPLALANVLLNNLLARSSFKLVPALCVLAIAYGFGLNYALAHSHHLVTALKTMGICNLALLGICSWYTWGSKPTSP